MRSNNNIILFSLFISALFIGGSIMFASYFYKQGTDAVKSAENAVYLGTYKRVVLVEKVDHQNGTITSLILDTDLFEQRRVIFFVAENSIIQRQDPIFSDDGTIVGFHELEYLTLEDIVPGARLFIRIRLSAEGDLIANQIVIGDPFPRP
jgi:hypothetical protein